MIKTQKNVRKWLTFYVTWVSYKFIFILKGKIPNE